jgi:hypothetical protein
VSGEGKVAGCPTCGGSEWIEATDDTLVAQNLPEPCPTCSADKQTCKRCWGSKRVIDDSLAFAYAGVTSPCPDCYPTDPPCALPESRKEAWNSQVSEATKENP